MGAALAAFLLWRRRRLPPGNVTTAERRCEIIAVDDVTSAQPRLDQGSVVSPTAPAASCSKPAVRPAEGLFGVSSYGEVIGCRSVDSLIAASPACGRKAEVPGAAVAAVGSAVVNATNEPRFTEVRNKVSPSGQPTHLHRVGSTLSEDQAHVEQLISKSKSNLQLSPDSRLSPCPLHSPFKDICLSDTQYQKNIASQMEKEDLFPKISTQSTKSPSVGNFRYFGNVKKII